MDILKETLPNFGEILKITWLIIFKFYGWVLFVWVIIYIMWKKYYGEIQHQYIHSQEWEFLQLRVPKENKASTLAVESIFAQMHSLHTGTTFVQKYVEGKGQLWYSLELVSLGGKIAYIIRIPKKMRQVVEASFYAQYPEIEIVEVNDYMENFNYNPEKDKHLEIWGTEVLLSDDWALPIRTYRDFEHPTAEDKIIDPLSPTFEVLSLVKPHEFLGIQIIISPVGDGDWKPHSENKVKELIGEEIPHEPSFTGTLLKPVEAFSHMSYKSLVLGGGHGHGGHGHEEGAPKNNWMQMTETEKERVSLIEKKASKPAYKTKIRWLYVAPKESFDKTKQSLLPGAYRHFSNMQSNKLKPDTKKTWTSAEYMISQSLEKPYLQKVINTKKRNIFKGYKDRDIHIGRPMFVMNIEEIATLYHFPITTETSPIPAAIDRVESKKSQAPSNLPIAEID